MWESFLALIQLGESEKLVSKYNSFAFASNSRILKLGQDLDKTIAKKSSGIWDFLKVEYFFVASSKTVIS